MKEEDIKKEAEEIAKELEQKPEEEQKKEKGPFIYLIAAGLIFLIALMIIPVYTIKLDPEPKTIPKIEDVILTKIEINNNKSHEIYSLQDLAKFVQPNEPIIKQTATKISTLSCENSKVCQAKAIFYFVRDNLKYVADPPKEYVEEPKELLLTEGGDCESGSILLASLEEAIGVDAQLVLIKNHAYVRIKLDDALKKYKKDDWIYLDWTCSKCKFGEIPWDDFVQEGKHLEVP